MTRNEKTFEAFWANLELEVRESGMNFSDFAKESGISYRTLMGWKAKGRTPDLENLIIIADTLNCSIDKLAGHVINNRWGAYVSALNEASAKDLKVIRAVLGIEEPVNETPKEAAKRLG